MEFHSEDTLILARKNERPAGYWRLAAGGWRAYFDKFRYTGLLHARTGRKRMRSLDEYAYDRYEP